MVGREVGAAARKTRNLAGSAQVERESRSSTHTRSNSPTDARTHSNWPRLSLLSLSVSQTHSQRLLSTPQKHARLTRTNVCLHLHRARVRVVEVGTRHAVQVALPHHSFRQRLAHHRALVLVALVDKFRELFVESVDLSMHCGFLRGEAGRGSSRRRHPC